MAKHGQKKAAMTTGHCTTCLQDAHIPASALGRKHNKHNASKPNKDGTFPENRSQWVSGKAPKPVGAPL